jgi:hypothetical protein
MQAQPEFRKTERIDYESIIKIEDEFSLSPYYAVSHNLSEMGMYFESLFEFYRGARILIRIDEAKSSKTPVLAKVVRCNKLTNQPIFRYGIGVKFLQPVFWLYSKPFEPIAYRMRTSHDSEREVMIEMEKRLPEQRWQPSTKYPVYAK